jgi:hypothetical protein
MDLEGKALTDSLGVGARGTLALGQQNVVLESRWLPKYAELVRRGLVYCASVAKAGIDQGTDIDTTGMFFLYNPVGSGYNAHILRASLAYLSGTLGSGIVYYASAIVTAAPTGGTAVAPKNALSTNAGAGSIKAFAGATLAAAPDLLRPLCTLSPMLATSVLGMPQVTEDVDGEFVVGPGSIFGLDAVAGAGTSPKLVTSLTYAQVPE